MIGSVGEALVVEGRKGRVEHVSAWAEIVAGRAGSRIQISTRLPRFPVMGSLL